MDTEDLCLHLAAINARLCGFTNTARAIEQAFGLTPLDEGLSEAWPQPGEPDANAAHSAEASVELSVEGSNEIVNEDRFVPRGRKAEPGFAILKGKTENARRQASLGSAALGRPEKILRQERIT